MKLLLLMVVAGALSAETAEYIVHWTSTEKCYECATRYAMACSSGSPDCNVPNKIVDHFELCASKELARKTAEAVANNTLAQGWIQSNWSTMEAKRNVGPGTVVAIYEARKLPIKVETKEYEVPQPAKKETSVIISLEADF